MARSPSPEIDDELFNEVYGKEYTGPPRSTANNMSAKANTNKRPSSGSQSDEEDESQDPNAVPTDFTSREAKVWEAKAKATERNWKKRKEEEMICKICGESGHFTQGCPSTLGANRKSADFFERVPARDKNVRTLFSEKVITQIERDIGCKIKMDEKFLIVSGKDRLILAKGVDAVHKVIQEAKGQRRSPASSDRMRSRSPDEVPRGSDLRRSESQRSHSSPRNMSRFQSRGFNKDRYVHDRVCENPQKFSRGFSEAYANGGGKGRPARSKSPLRPAFGGDAYRPYDGHSYSAGLHKSNNWDTERCGIDSHSERKFDFPNYPATLEELEMEFKRGVMELATVRDQEEDEENYKHRECIRELRENYMKKLARTRSMHAKQWEEFLQFDRQKWLQGQLTAYNQQTYADCDQASRNMQYVRSGLLGDSRSRYRYHGENYSASRPHDSYGEMQHQRHESFGKAYGRC
ncbi:uncharacterized protein LOC103712717 isoform X2 [Phoenix dactylifera]|uniref:Uncharacterized protein LOC103712717 isoform X2 n=1 Tax=Phoenix dactylifera TaxID=42345 RepID=A0A8B8J7J3_PHODC|nr:uncharacterized protein LOC103712717 isoform X2 [Phoenix dactylifera]